jgi:hypothetical protein
MRAGPLGFANPPESRTPRFGKALTADGGWLAFCLGFEVAVALGLKQLKFGVPGATPSGAQVFAFECP